MLNFEKLFKIHFDTKEVSDDRLLKFAHDHIQRLKANNQNEQFTDMIDATAAVYKNYLSSVSNKHHHKSVQKAKTYELHKIIREFKQTVSQKEGLIRAAFGRKSPQYLEFFSRGMNEYAQASKSNIIKFMDVMIEAGNKYKDIIGEEFVKIFGKIRHNYINTRSKQLKQIGTVDMDRSNTASYRKALEIQLCRNLLAIASIFIGDPRRGNDFFNQSIVKKNYKSKETEEKKIVLDIGTYN